MNQLQHYAEMADELEKRIDAVETIYMALDSFAFSSAARFSALNIVSDALVDLGVDPVELQLGFEKAMPRKQTESFDEPWRCER